MEKFLLVNEICCPLRSGLFVCAFSLSCWHWRDQPFWNWGSDPKSVAAGSKGYFRKVTVLPPLLLCCLQSWAAGESLFKSPLHLGMSSKLIYMALVTEPCSLDILLMSVWQLIQTSNSHAKRSEMRHPHLFPVFKIWVYHGFIQRQ